EAGMLAQVRPYSPPSANASLVMQQFSMALCPHRMVTDRSRSLGQTTDASPAEFKCSLASYPSIDSQARGPHQGRLAKTDQWAGRPEQCWLRVYVADGAFLAPPQSIRGPAGG